MAAQANAARQRDWRVVADGQSMLIFPESTDACIDQLMANYLVPFVPWDKVAVGGEAWQNLTVTAPTRRDLARGSTTNSILLLNGGQTNLGLGSSGATLYTQIVNYGNAARAAGYDYVVAQTMTPANGFTGPQETQRLAYNVALNADASAAFDAVVDVAADPLLDDSTDATYYDQVSGVHWTAAGALVAANLTKPAIDTIMGV